MKTSPHDRIRALATLWEDTSPESLTELLDLVDPDRLEAAVAILSNNGADADAARTEAQTAAAWLARLGADLSGMQLTASRMRGLIKAQIAAVKAQIEFYEGWSVGGSAAARVVAKALARQALHDGTAAAVGSLAIVVRGLRTQLAALETVERSLPTHKLPDALQAVFIANEARRFLRLTGLAPAKTRDPDTDAVVGPFADYIRALEASVALNWTFTTRQIRNGLDLAREPDVEGESPTAEPPSRP
jgi:hypothetical protein